MICFDTNIFVYLANYTLSQDIITDIPICFPSVAKIEALGYREIRSVEESRIRLLLDEFIEIPLSGVVVERAIGLRQARRMSLGDSIVAATALVYDCELWTANTADFAQIDGLRLVNPLQ